MDLEQRVEKLEEEFRHERSMRRIQADRLDAQDRQFDAIRENLAEASRVVKETASQMQETQAQMRELRGLVKELIEGLLRGRQNGKP